MKKTLLLLLIAPMLFAQVRTEQLVRAAQEPNNWLTYSGSYYSQRYSTLNQITPANVKNLQMRWTLQVKSLEKFEATPLVVDGRMYLTQAPNDVLALDATSGRVFWQYTHEPSPKARLCCGIGEFLLGKPFETVTWATVLDAKGRPILARDAAPTPEGKRIQPGVQGATNWYSPSFSPRTGLFYIPTWVGYYSTFTKYEVGYEPGLRFTGGTPRSVIPGTRNVGYINTRREEDGSGAIRAIDPQTGDRKWEFKLADVTDSGILTTSTDLLFTGSRDGSFYALDAKTGVQLWRGSVGGQVVAGPMTYRVGNTQYVAIAAGSAMFSFALPE